MLFKGSVVSSITRALICIVILSVLATGLALITVVGSLKDAEAVNISGSLRMQSYRLAHDITTNSADLSEHLSQYKQSLQAPALTKLNRFYVPENVTSQYQTLLARWQVLEQEIKNGHPSLYLTQVADYVDQIDNFVLAVQRFSELKLWGALAISCLGFIMTLAVVFFTIHFARRQIVSPLNKMVQASQSIQSGHFNHLALDTSLPNELGLLSATFNTMSYELEKLYRSLEDKVAEKTRLLTQVNRTLGVLYSCSQALSSEQLNNQCVEKVLTIVSESEKMSAIQLEVNDSSENCWLLNKGEINQTLVWHDLILKQEQQSVGTLRWQIDNNTTPDLQLIQNVANMLSRAIYINRSQKQHVQLLLMEERATIARELHDSLAQALSFLRIQLTLLHRTLSTENDQALAIVADFDQALATAYQQLRELLTTFRLSIEQADLHEALNQLVNPMRSQTEAEIQLNCLLPSQALNAQQQVHALQIVREAVINAIKHAQAKNIIINCASTTDGYNMFTITDDGKGIDSIEEPDGHYGLNIMHERAGRLNGTITIARNLSAGTTVKLVFPH